MNSIDCIFYGWTNSFVSDNNRPASSLFTRLTTRTKRNDARRVEISVFRFFLSHHRCEKMFSSFSRLILVVTLLTLCYSEHAQATHCLKYPNLKGFLHQSWNIDANIDTWTKVREKIHFLFLFCSSQNVQKKMKLFHSNAISKFMVICAKWI